MKPYYGPHHGITIYHGDCREVLPDVWFGVDLLLTDPPYGMAYKPLRGSNGSKRFTGKVHGDDSAFDPSHLLSGKPTILFGANWYADRLPPSGGWIVWDKTPHGAKHGFIASHAELAWTNVATRVHKFSMQWGGEAHGGEDHFHPTQKPVALMRWIISQWTQLGGLVLDPYMGSGPVVIAAKETGRSAIGIEIEERYCEIAAKRLAQGVLPLELGA